MDRIKAWWNCLKDYSVKPKIISRPIDPAKQSHSIRFQRTTDGQLQTLFLQQQQQQQQQP